MLQFGFAELRSAHLSTWSAMAGLNGSDVLLQHPFFKKLAPSVRTHLGSMMQELKLPQGTVLFRQGDPPGCCYIIKEGAVEVYKKSQEDCSGHDSREGSPREKKGSNHDSSDDSSESSESGPEDAAEHGQCFKGRAVERKMRRQSVLMQKAVKRQAAATRPTIMQAALLAAEAAHSPGRCHRRRSSTTGAECWDPEQAATPLNIRARAKSVVGFFVPKLPAISRIKTHEGFSYYHEASDLGTFALTLPEGSIVGEHALLEECTRSASIKCATDCEFFVISRQDLDNVFSELKSKKAEKLNFLQSHLPGLKHLPPPRNGRLPPACFFQQAHYPKGHVFLKQGRYSCNLVWVVQSGSVGFWHLDPQSQTETSKSLGDFVRPSSATGSKPLRQLPCPQAEIAGGKGRCVATILTGGVFGSLPHDDPEPFTVVAQSTCKIYFVPQAQFTKLPKKLANAIYDYLARSTLWRLRHCLESRAALPMKPVAVSRPGSPALAFQSRPGSPAGQTRQPSQARQVRLGSAAQLCRGVRSSPQRRPGSPASAFQSRPGSSAGQTRQSSEARQVRLGSAALLSCAVDSAVPWTQLCRGVTSSPQLCRGLSRPSSSPQLSHG
eukprot:TRINITY_DN5609_c0_g1_i2.p1 TRINITY_DN5609_c0_g1~~TRINITY_DN5609_c0_g1_i2.p1  ORF type:complete len:608 (-),score=91.11 TRINITY_DN5609_c0_g1_i2:59-1882(-)